MQFQNSVVGQLMILSLHVECLVYLHCRLFYSERLHYPVPLFSVLLFPFEFSEQTFDWIQLLFVEYQPLFEFSLFRLGFR